MSQLDTQTTDTTEQSDAQEESEQESVVLETNPTTKPTLIRLGLVLLLSLGLFGYLQFDPQALGSPDITNTAALIVLLLGLVLTIRFLVRTLVLTRTRYVVTGNRVEQRYELLYRTHSKGVRFDKVRSHELNQNRVQSLLGYGTISMNRGLGPLRLENVDEPQTVYETIRTCIDRTESE
ncbi:PH domain-containing protein [Halosimplex pelagicum]|uniref:PH domain-containing protein n=1 Tax=Halosimplex pelagicum TaxID=869886 RepID=A0A7D5TRL7_9EURY|nr:PH domain-containing protein [Halosimplex pelagicum]QLH81372.1 PH domain-containing protein [Halosimplex pelagicum]